MNSDRDFQIEDKKFKLNKLDPFKQFHILRRLTPILADLAPVVGKLSTQSGTDQLQGLVPVLNGISKLSDEDANFVLLGLLSSVEMQQSSGNWARVAMESQLMFQDLELPTLMQIAGKAFGYNLKRFLAVPPQGLPVRG